MLKTCKLKLKESPYIKQIKFKNSMKNKQEELMKENRKKWR